MKQCGDGQKTNETGQIAHEGFRPDLFPEVELRITLQYPTTLVRGPHQGDAAVSEHVFQVEIVAELPWRQWVHRLADGPAGQQVRAGHLELARAGTEQGEAQAALLDQAVHLVQQGRNALHLIDNDPIARCAGGNQLPEQRRVGQQVVEQGFIQQVETQCLGQGRASP